MIRSSALYMVIVMALVIALICAALVGAAGFYQLQYLKKFRSGRLHNDLISAQNLALQHGRLPERDFRAALFDAAEDSIAIESYAWGLYDVALCRAFLQSDTVRSAFLMARVPDSLSSPALYITDEDRPISVSGKSRISGAAYLPKAGIEAAYVADRSYEGDKRLVIGEKRVSGKTLPALNAGRLLNIDNYYAGANQKTEAGISKESLNASFQRQPAILHLDKNASVLQTSFTGHILIQSDTLITIDSSARLSQVIVCAPAVRIMSGFQGDCQIFVTDSARIGERSILRYPSAIVAVRQSAPVAGQPPRITLEKGASLYGSICCYDATSNTSIKPVIDLGSHVILDGHIYTNGYLNYHPEVQINGSLYTGRTLFQSNYARFENYLIDIQIDIRKRSKYYLSSDLFPDATGPYQILQWLN